MLIPQRTSPKLVLATLLCAGALVARAAPPKTQTYYALSDTVFVYPQAEMHVTEIVIAQGEKNCQMALAELQLSHVPKPRAPHPIKHRTLSEGCFTALPPEIDNVRTSKPLTDQVYYVRRSVNSLAGKVVTVQVLYPVPNVGVPSDLCEQMAADYRKQSPDAKCIAPTAAQPEPAPQPRN